MRFRSRKTPEEPRIEITPLIDVVFQLLIFFLLTTRFITERSVDVDLPTASAEVRSEDSVALILELTEQGETFHQGAPVDNRTVDALLRAQAAQSRSKLLLRADRRLALEVVVSLMDRARAVGVEELGIATLASEGRGSQEPASRRGAAP